MWEAKGPASYTTSGTTSALSVRLSTQKTCHAHLQLARVKEKMLPTPYSINSLESYMSMTTRHPFSAWRRLDTLDQQLLWPKI